MVRADPRQPGRRVYLLQGTTRRLTIHAQQVRALNLVHSLVAEKQIEPRQRIAIVGGGFSGVMAALASAYVGCDVRLFERKPTLLHLQTGSYTRWVHPNMFDWPETVSEKEETELPFLNWFATTAAEAARLVMDEFREHLGAGVPGQPGTIGDRIKIDTSEEVELAGATNKLRVANTHRQFQAIILATGFGTESTIPEVPFRSYWMCDSLHQPNMLTGRGRSEYVVSGTGDGALIDLLRLRIADFRQDLLVKDLFDHRTGDEAGDLAELKNRLRNIRRVVLREANEALGIDLLEEGLTDLSESPGFQLVKERLSERLRPDTVVHLHGRSERYLSPHASILHTFLAFVLRQLHAFDYYWGGDLEIQHTARGLSVSLPESGGTNRTEAIPRETIVRHGPQLDNPRSAIVKLVTEYRQSLDNPRVLDLQHTTRRVEGNTNAWWAERGVKNMREAVGRPTSVTQLRDTRDSARRTFGLLEESVILQRSLFVRGAIGEFINGPLYDAFHDLVYSYRDEEWETAHRLVTGRFGDGELELFDASRVTANRAETWELLAAMNERLLEGSRRYHPAFFQGSEEERRLDQVLEYFNMVGSYWTRGLLKDEDLEPLDSYALLLVDRKAIAFYLAYSKEVWARRKEIRWREANIPFTHLRRLLVWAGGRRTQRENPQPDSETGPSQVRSAE